MSNPDPIARALACLAEERALLKAGRISELPRVVADRERVLAELGDANAEDLAEVREMARVNGALITAAGDGIRAALARVDELSRAAGPIGSYTATGARQEIGSIRPKCERKA